ncbi:MAG TPA: hypothetical protein VEB86_14770 [Chryseosolibacter sp.]|nr:hypothetical protein [Chryseosolibacter sp.]
MKLFYLLFASCIMLSGAGANAQSITSGEITWQADSLTDVPSDSSYAIASQFVTGQSSIEWIQKNGTYVREFAVVATTGEWADVSQDGEIVYSVTLNGRAGEIKVGRYAGTHRIRLTYERSEAETLEYSFHISGFAQN